jgi:hypothetical protein
MLKMGSKILLVLTTTALVGCYSSAQSRSNQAYYRVYCSECVQKPRYSCCAANSMNSTGCTRCNNDYNRVDYHSNGYFTQPVIYRSTPY